MVSGFGYVAFFSSAYLLFFEIDANFDTVLIYTLTTGTDILYINAAGNDIIILNSVEAIAAVMDQNGALCSDR